jgi:hypothetical protein
MEVIGALYEMYNGLQWSPPHPPPFGGVTPSPLKSTMCEKMGLIAHAGIPYHDIMSSEYPDGPRWNESWRESRVEGCSPLFALRNGAA